MCSVEERFWNKVLKTDDCWTWTSAKSRKGYGLFWDGNKFVRAHRASYVLAFGPIPDGMCVCHHCDNPSCVRPDHLFIGTNADNVHDSIAKGRFRFLPKVPKSHLKPYCKNGHPFSESNTRITERGYRVCRACRVVNNRARRQRLAS